MELCLRNNDRLNSSLETWYHQPLGAAVIAAESAKLSTVLPKFFGLHLLQLGGVGQLDWLTSSPIHHRVVIQPQISANPQGSVVQGIYDQLPFRGESIDMILVPHTLEYDASPRTLLTEAWRVLSLDGHLIILGFNPWSLWGLARLFKKHSAGVPWTGHFHSADKVSNWLIELGGAIVLQHSFYYLPPLSTPHTAGEFNWIEKMGQQLFPQTGGIYLLVVQKRTIPLDPLPAKWSWRELVDNKGFAEPTVGRMPRG